jgi:hypothetical protein
MQAEVHGLVWAALWILAEQAKGTKVPTRIWCDNLPALQYAQGLQSLNLEGIAHKVMRSLFQVIEDVNDCKIFHVHSHDLEVCNEAVDSIAKATAQGSINESALPDFFLHDEIRQAPDSIPWLWLLLGPPREDLPLAIIGDKQFLYLPVPEDGKPPENLLHPKYIKQRSKARHCSMHINIVSFNISSANDSKPASIIDKEHQQTESLRLEAALSCTIPVSQPAVCTLCMRPGAQTEKVRHF